MAASCCIAQEDAAGGAARARGRPAASVRIEATSYIQWHKAPIDSSHGSSTYWLHVSAASGGRTTSGGFTIDMHPRMLGKINAIHINGASGSKMVSGRTAPPETPSGARLMGTCSYGGKEYEIQIDVVSNVWRPSPVPGGRGTSVKGSVRLKMTEAAAKAIDEAAGVRQSSVTIWQQ